MNYIIDLLVFFKNKDRYFAFTFLATAVSALFISAVLLIFSSQLPSKLPLFYSLPWGEKQLVNQFGFFILPIILIVFSLINFTLALQLHSLQIILKRMLILTSLAIDIIIVVSFIRVIFIFI